MGDGGAVHINSHSECVWEGGGILIQFTSVSGGVGGGGQFILIHSVCAEGGGGHINSVSVCVWGGAVHINSLQ